MPESVSSMPMHDQYNGTTNRELADKSRAMETARQLPGIIKTHSCPDGGSLALQVDRSRKTGEITFDQMVHATRVPAIISAKRRLHS